MCRVDGRLVTVAQLRELGRQLLNIHGQHDGQQLLDPASHLGYLDRFGRHEPLWRNTGRPITAGMTCGSGSPPSKWTRRSAPAGWTR